MFFLSSKIIWLLIAPSSLLCLLFMLALTVGYLSYPRASRVLLSIAASIFLIFGCTHIADSLLLKWETQYKRPTSDLQDFDGVVILGGGVDIKQSQTQGQLVFNGRDSRFLTALELIDKSKHLKVIYSGGNGYLVNNDRYIAEAELVEGYLKSRDNYNPARFYYERESKNTYQNAAYSRKIFLDIYRNREDLKDRKWLLLSSAYHLPRSMKVFEAQNWNVTAYPSRYLAEDKPFWLPSLKFWDKWRKIDVLAHEILGIIAYKMTDRI